MVVEGEGVGTAGDNLHEAGPARAPSLGTDTVR